MFMPPPVVIALRWLPIPPPAQGRLTRSAGRKNHYAYTGARPAGHTHRDTGTPAPRHRDPYRDPRVAVTHPSLNYQPETQVMRAGGGPGRPGAGGACECSGSESDTHTARSRVTHTWQ